MPEKAPGRLIGEATFGLKTAWAMHVRIRDRVRLRVRCVTRKAGRAGLPFSTGRAFSMKRGISGLKDRQIFEMSD
ncbi:hypothetical protein AB833_16665 [Chromatiales bacterium (ex Bugula neritina AB1)]|nr:hypothetical protein AB833_16665 [Chromatiales bacterium (ex Bugula neritina AB1)]